MGGFYARGNAANALMQRNNSALAPFIERVGATVARTYAANLSPAADKNCTCFKCFVESIKSRAAMQIANKRLFDHLPLDIFGVPT
jgi:hypothetical protein